MSGIVPHPLNKASVLPVARASRAAIVTAGCVRLTLRPEHIRAVGKAGRAAGQIAALSRIAQVRRSNLSVGTRWPSRHGRRPACPKWPTEAAYKGQILPRLSKVPHSAIATALGVSKPYASEVRAGKRCPHSRHWQLLSKLVEVSKTE